MQFVMPQLGLTMEEGTIAAWLVAVGDQVRRGTPMVEIATDKANTEVEAPADGVVEELLAVVGATLPVGTPIALLRLATETVIAVPSGDTIVEVALPTPPTASTLVVPPDDERIIEPPIRASPAARTLAREHNLDILTLAGKGSGPGGRIIFRDVEQMLAAREPTRPLPPPAEQHSQRRLPLGAIRAATVRRLNASRDVVPITLMEELNAGPLVELYQAIRAARPRMSLSYSDLFAFALARTLPHHPLLNSSYLADDPPALELHPTVNLNLAVALPEPSGLVAPVLHGIDALDLASLAIRRATLVERARTGRLRPDDLEGGTFTLSNLGMYRVRSFTPLVLPPQVAILGVGRITTNGGGAQLTLSLSVDHRAVDGAPAAHFLTDLISLLEQPLALLLPPEEKADV